MQEKPTSCDGCPLRSSAEWGKNYGYVPASGTGDNGVLIVAEAGGEQEELDGYPLVGAAGQYLWSQLQRVGIERDEFRIHNVLSCRPPNNELIKMPYTEAAIAACAPNLDRTISDHIGHCRTIGRAPVIVALGRFAAERLLGWEKWHPGWKEDYTTYPHWSERYQCWILCTYHPAYLARGKHSLAPVMRFTIQRAIEIAAGGLDVERPRYLLDPTSDEFDAWAEGYFRAQKADPANTYLSFDIETPYKSGKNEAEIAREDDDDYTILRCSFSYKAGDSCSVQWDARFIRTIERLFGVEGAYLVSWNGEVYDLPRIVQYVQVKGISLDAMLAWHVLNTSMPKGLGFVTPFYWKNTKMWKHMAAEKGEEAFYNAKDADAALRNWLGIKEDLRSNGLWHVFEEHVVRLNEVLSYMSRQGVLLDQTARKEAEVKLDALLTEIDGRIQGAVPQRARQFKVYKKDPKDVTGHVQVPADVATTQCPNCLLLGVRAPHFKSVGKKRLAKGDSENPCHGAKSSKITVPGTLWAQPLTFKLSSTGLKRYQATMGHKPIIDRKKKTTTFDVKALKTLRKNYPSDPLYPIIGEFRGTQKLLGTYVGVEEQRKLTRNHLHRLREGEVWLKEATPEHVGQVMSEMRVWGGMPVGRDGRVHTLYLHNPSTLRLSSASPNLQNLPRPDKDPNALQNLIRNLIVAQKGHILTARDFSGIEAVLVGHDAQDPDYIRLARRDVHSFYTAYALHTLDGRVSANDLPLLSWDDDKLFTRLSEIKEAFKHDRNTLYKHLVHAINFGQGAMGARDKIYEETDILFDVRKIGRAMDIYRELFPKIGKWQRDVRLQADDAGLLRNAFGYVHRFNHVFSWKMKNGIWDKVPGDDAEAVLAFKPQSNAAGIMKAALLRLYFDYFEEVGQYLRLTVHDEILCECPEEKREEVDAIMQAVMEEPVKVLTLPDSYKMGPYLSILTEPKWGERWGKMKG